MNKSMNIFKRSLQFHQGATVMEFLHSAIATIIMILYAYIALFLLGSFIPFLTTALLMADAQMAGYTRDMVFDAYGEVFIANAEIFAGDFVLLIIVTLLAIALTMLLYAWLKNTVYAKIQHKKLSKKSFTYSILFQIVSFLSLIVLFLLAFLFFSFPIFSLPYEGVLTSVPAFFIIIPIIILLYSYAMLTYHTFLYQNIKRKNILKLWFKQSFGTTRLILPFLLTIGILILLAIIIFIIASLLPILIYAFPIALIFYNVWVKNYFSIITHKRG